MGVATGLQGSDIVSEMSPSVVWAVPERAAIHCLSGRNETAQLGRKEKLGWGWGVTLSQTETARQLPN